MTTPLTTFDATTNAPSRFLLRPLASTDTQIHMPYQTWMHNVPLPNSIGPVVDIGEERLVMTTGAYAARAAMTLAAAANAGDSTITVNTTAHDVDASTVNGITNLLSIVDGGATEAVTVIDSDGAVLTLSTPLASAHAQDIPVTWIVNGSYQQTKNVITVTRGAVPLDHPRGAQVSKIYTPTEFQTRIEAGTFYTAFLEVVGAHTRYYFIPARQMEANRGDVVETFPAPANAVCRLGVLHPDYGDVEQMVYGEVILSRVADTTGAPLASPYDWYTAGELGPVVGDVSAPLLHRLTADINAGDSPTADFTVTDGEVVLTSGGWFSLRFLPQG